MKFSRVRLITAIIVIVLVGGIGTYVFARSNAQSVTDSQIPVIEPAKANLLRPLSLGYSPYQYVAYSSSVKQSYDATKVTQYFAAFVISDKTCNPTWGGASYNDMDSIRANQIGDDIAAVKAAGGNVAVSFGGSNGTELALACDSVDELAASYDKVITKYNLNRVDFDIEAEAIRDNDATVRRAQAVAKLQQSHPGLQVYVTLPVQRSGLTTEGVSVLSAFINAKVTLRGVNIMAMNYNQIVSDMGSETEVVADASVEQLAKLYPNNPRSDIWKALGVTVMVGSNNTPSEVFTLANAGRLRSYAEQKGIGTLSIWNIARDAPCSSDNTPQPDISCSGQPQKYYDYTWALKMSPRD